MQINRHSFLMVCILGLASSMAHSVEEPKYSVIGTIGEVELRQYQAMVQAVTRLQGNGNTTEGFRRLAGFIFGGNDAERKIAMTAPVQETLGGETTEMAFTMPAEYSMDSLPSPADPTVTLRDLPARTVAVIQFSGWATAGKVQKFQDQLRSVVQSHNLEAAGLATLNQYNPPWTPPFLRRNEIMLEISMPAHFVETSGSVTPTTQTYSF